MTRSTPGEIVSVSVAMCLAFLVILAVSMEMSGRQVSAADGDPQQQPLADQQSQLAERYRKIEELFMRLADMESAENPERAALLRRAAKKSRDSFILDRLSEAAGSLSSEKYQQALASQKSAQEEMESLLKLLMSEDRSKRIREEKDRITNAIKEVKRLERSERATRARTENGADLKELEQEQKSIEKRAADVEAALKEDNEDFPDENSNGAEQESDAKSSDSKEGQRETPDTENKEQASDSDNTSDKPSDSPNDKQDEKDRQAGDDSDEGKPKDKKESSDNKGGKNQQGEQQQGEQQQGEQQQGEQQQGEQQQGEQQQQSEMPPATPEEAAERAVKKARENMQRAIEKLEKAEREEAVEQQKQAEDELRKAIEMLEQILRQLREEEMLRELARLESRLRQMAQMQAEVLDKTKQLAETPEPQRDRQTAIRSGNLAFDEKKIILEADRATLLLREEGSSVAFPFVVDQMRDDMQRVADRLSQTKIDAITQGIQEDILAALEEMIGALQKAQRDLEKQQEQQQQQQQQQSGQQGEPPLVQPLAELKLVKTLQTRIRSTTERYGQMLPEDTEAASDPDLLNLIKDLSVRQIKLYQIMRDLSQERNK